MDSQTRKEDKENQLAITKSIADQVRIMWSK